MEKRSLFCRAGWIVAVLPACLLAAGCGATAQPPKPPPLKVENSAVVVKDDVVDYETFTGRIASIPTVTIVARATGYLDKVGFKDGDFVKKDQMLFVIDQRPYQTALDQSRAALEQARASLKPLEKIAQRDIELLPSGSVSREEYEQAIGNRDVAAAQVRSSQAAVATAELNYSFTVVKAPFDGYISRRLLDPGNMVMTDQTVLTYLASVDPIYVYFDVNERTVLRVQRLLAQAPQTSSGESWKPSVALGLSDQKGFGRAGAIEFVDTKEDPQTGTLQERAKFDNKDRALLPGMFARIRLQTDFPHHAMLVAESALGSDQGRKYVLVVNEKNKTDDGKSYKVVQHYVEAKQTHDGLIEVVNPSPPPKDDPDGLREDDRVITVGLQRLHKDMPVDPKEPTPMPRAAQQDKPPPLVANPPAGDAGKH